MDIVDCVDQQVRWSNGVKTIYAYTHTHTHTLPLSLSLSLSPLIMQFYVEDSFGLRTLDESGRVHVITLPGVQHFEFHKKQSVFDCCIKQWLD